MVCTAEGVCCGRDVGWEECCWLGKYGFPISISLIAKLVIGVVLPFIAEASLRRFGPRVTLQTWTVVTVRFLDIWYLASFED